MIRYFATYTDPKLLGKTKLMKLFYFSDFNHVKQYASPITYDNYVNLEHGPIPSTIMNLVSVVETDLDLSILGDTISIETRDGSNMKRIVMKGKFTEEDKKYFNKTELKIMEEVAKKFKDSTGKNIEDISHKEAPWRTTKETENISYTLAAKDPDCLVDEEDIATILEITG